MTRRFMIAICLLVVVLIAIAEVARSAKPGQVQSASAQASQSGQTRVYADFKTNTTARADLEKYFITENHTGEHGEVNLKEWIGKHFSLLTVSTPSESVVAKWAIESGTPTLVYIDCPTNNGCKAPLTPTEVETAAKTATKAKEAGASGVFLDDTNFSCGVRASTQEKCMTEAGAEKEAIQQQELVKRIRSEWPAAIIDINSHSFDWLPLWKTGKTLSKIVEETIKEAKTVHNEWGVGKVALPTRSQYEAYIAVVPELHTLGIHVVLGGEYNIKEGNEVPEYELASFYLVTDGGDDVGWTTPKSDSPANFWPGWCAVNHSPCTISEGNLNMGAADELKNKLYVRGYQYPGAAVVVTAPGVSTKEWFLNPEWKSTEWGTGHSVLLLPEKHGAVLHF